MMILFLLLGIAGHVPGQNETAVQALCGPQCLFVLNRLSGKADDSLSEISRQCSLDPATGVTMPAMKKYLLDKGYKVNAVKVGPDEIDLGKSVYLIPVRLDGSEVYNHYNLLLGRKGEEVYLFDGSTKFESAMPTDLWRIWDGETLEIYRTWGPPAATSDAPRVSPPESSGFVWKPIPGSAAFISESKITFGKYAEFLTAAGRNDELHGLRERIRSTTGASASKEQEVSFVAMKDAEDFCRWLGTGYRLPTLDEYRAIIGDNGTLLHFTKYTGTISSHFASSSEAGKKRAQKLPVKGLTEGVGELTSTPETIMQANAAAGRDVPTVRKDEVYILTYKNDQDVWSLATCFTFVGMPGLGFRVVWEPGLAGNGT